MILCSGCPRSYHYTCLDRDFKAKSKGKMQFHCPQHQCADCQQNTTDAGGMLYRWYGTLKKFFPIYYLSLACEKCFESDERTFPHL